MKGYSKIKDMNSVNKIYKFLIEKKTREELIFDEVFYNTLLDIFWFNNCLEQVEEILREMRQNNIQFSNVTYSILVKIKSKKGENLQNLIKILEEMKVKKIAPGLIIYTCLIKQSIKHRNFKKAFDLFSEMKASKVSADHIFYSCIINGCLRNKLVEEACRLMDESISSNVRMSDQIYNKFFHILISKKTILNAKTKLGHLEKIYSLLKERSFKLEGETLQMLRTFVCKTKGISSDVFRCD
jgi:pentatricopeptide repeat protein